jgi:F0F1-type ATP synthase epsilon subunit
MGIIEVLPNHMQLVSALSTGDIILKIGDEERKKIPIQGGVLEVRAKSNIIILVN